MADGLSRAHEESEKSPSTRSFWFSCEVVDLVLDMVSTEQEKDEDIQVITKDLLEEEDWRPDFVLINGVLYKLARNENECLPLYILKTQIHEVLKQTHSHKLAGHPGIKKVRTLFSK